MAVATLAMAMAAFLGLSGSTPATDAVAPPPAASAQQTCYDLGWYQATYHVYHGVECYSPSGHTHAWDYYGPGGQYGGLAFYYFLPANITYYEPVSLRACSGGQCGPFNFTIRLRKANAPTTAWQNGSAAPGMDYKLWDSISGFGGDLDIIVTSIANAGSSFLPGCNCNVAVINTF